MSLRLVEVDGEVSLYVASHSGHSGSTAGELAVSKRVSLSKARASRALELLDLSRFWASPVEIKETRGIADGDRLVIEGVRNGKYHIIDRAGSVTGESVRAFCRSLLELAEEPTSLMDWDRIRKEEKSLPGYVREPTQTEDRGQDG